MSNVAYSIICYTDADMYAGTERYVLDLCASLQSIELQALIAAPAHSVLNDRSISCNIPFIAIEKASVIDKRAVEIISSQLYSIDPLIIHANNGRTLLNSCLAIKRTGKGHCVFTQHFLQPDHVAKQGMKGLVFRTAHKWVNKHTDHFIAISEAVKREMLLRGDAPETKITVIPNGISDPLLQNIASRDEVRRELGIGQDVPLVVSVARLEREKDIRSLVAAMKRVKQAHPETQCIIAGDGTLKNELAIQISEVGLSDSVHLLGYRTDALNLISASDLFVLPSLAEAFGLVLLEAMALSKPVVATRAGGPVEIVDDGETGLLTPPSDPEEMARSIVALVGEAERRVAMGTRGRSRYEERFTAHKMALATKAVYERVLEGSPTCAS